MIKDLLFATDFSESAQAAGRWAVETARQHGAHIHLTHALHLPSHATPYVVPPPDTSKELQQAALKRLSDAASELREFGVRVTERLEVGLPSQVIHQAAETHSCDLIVMGTQGLTGLKHLLLGSTAERVIHHAPCPVLTVHTSDLERQGPLKRVLVPTDFSPQVVRACTVALDLMFQQPGEASLILLHAYQLPFEYTAYGSIPTTWDYLKDVAGSAKEELEKQAQGLRQKGWTVETVNVEGPPADLIASYARENDVDLIAMGTHDRSGLSHLLLGSVTHRMLQLAACPVLVVPPEAE